MRECGCEEVAVLREVRPGLDVTLHSGANMWGKECGPVKTLLPKGRSNPASIVTGVSTTHLEHSLGVYMCGLG